MDAERTRNGGPERLMSTSAWFQIFGVLLAVALAIPTVQSFLHDPGRLEIRIVHDLPLVDSSVQAMPVKLVWSNPIGFTAKDEVEIVGVRCTTVAIENRGDEPLDWDRDIIQEIAFTAEDPARILAVISPREGRSDPNIPVRIEQRESGNVVAVATNILNPGDRIPFQIFHTGDRQALGVQGRIKSHPPISLDTQLPRPRFDKRPVVQLFLQQIYAIGLLATAIIVGWRAEVLKETWRTAISRSIPAGWLGPTILGLPILGCQYLWPETIDSVALPLLYVHGLGSAAACVVLFYFYTPDSRTLLLSLVVGAPAARECRAVLVQMATRTKAITVAEGVFDSTDQTSAPTASIDAPGRAQ